MSSTELIVVVGGLFLGYWIVSNMINPKSSAGSKKHPPDKNANTSQNKNGQEKSSQEGREPSSMKEEDIPASWFRILEISETATMEEITAAYKQQIRQYHPDKVASLGEELRDLAEFKSKQINTAYDYAKKLRNQE